ncbi:MAG TPA: lysoplasmalogenase [Candidatus Hydrogenedens sp.]|nr:lysoplasmalogenase [Candidatus Hydrogenedens sp.]
MQHVISAVIVMAFFLLMCLYGEYKKKPWTRAIGKMMASNCFLYIAFSTYWLYDVPDSLHITMIWIIVGLVCSWWGDLFLLSRNSVIFLLGLVSFLLAHVCYILAFFFAQVDWSLTISAMGVSLVPAIAIGFWLNPNLGDMRIPVYMYMIIISCMVSFAIGAWAYGGLWNLPLGALIFYASDIFVARDRFKTADKWNFLIGGPLYFLGQVFLASTPLWIN